MTIEKIALEYSAHFIKPHDELLDMIFASGFHQFPQSMRSLMNCTWTGRE